MQRRNQFQSLAQLRLLGVMLLLLLVTGCAAPVSYADTQATAQVTGCWPDTFPTPRSVTFTPLGAPTATVIGATAIPGVPTLTALPTTTSIPRCPPAPGSTAIPWPTAVPPAPPYPTIEPRSWVGGSWRQTTLLLPVKVLAIDMAVHPSEGWPAVASVVWSGNEDPERVFVSVYNPQTNGWSSARQVDLGVARIGRYSRTVAIAITGDRTVHVVWAMSDPNFTTNDPPSGVWTASSSDFGASWSAPERIATGCMRVNSTAATPEGTLVVQLNCDTGPRSAQPVIRVRTPDGIWQPPERLPIPAWKYSEGRVVISGHGADAQIISVVLGGSAGNPTAFLARRPLVGGTWQFSTRAMNGSAALRMWQIGGLSYDRLRPDSGAEAAITYTWTSADASQGVYALTSLDGGASWGEVEQIYVLGASGAKTLFNALAYDPAADRLVAFFTCCGDASWEWVESTHYARWSRPGSGSWQTLGGEDAGQLVPLTLASRAAAQTVVAQAPGSRSAWIAWIDTLQRIEVRSVELNQFIPVDQYPMPTVIGGER